MIDKKATRPLMTAALIAFLAGCGDSALQDGGGAGDNDTTGSSTAEAIALLTPFAGIFDLDDGWSGQAGDEAFLQISEPNDQGQSIATLHDFDDIDNCIPDNPQTGVVRIEPTEQRVFMDNLPLFFDAELTLSGSVLTIEFEDNNDIDNDGSNSDSATVRASRLGVSQVTDLGATC